MRLLIVEDDAEASEAMARGLAEAGHECVAAEDGEKGLLAARGGRFDVMVVDRMMPRVDGVTMVERLRKEGDQTPVLFLSALGEISHRVEGLKAGGDDYLVKPYAFAELIARVEALARRRETGSVQTLLRVGELEMDLIGREVRRKGQEIDLQPREFQLLEFLMRHAAKILEPRDPRALDNVNTPDEYREAVRSFEGGPSAARSLKIQYYALMREQAGRSDEMLETTASTPADLYSELKTRYGFTLSREQLKVAVNSEFASWSQQLAAGDSVVFIPPVAGG